MGQQIWTLGSERYINRVNTVAVMSADSAQSYPGLLGAEHYYTQEEAERLTDTTVTDYSTSTKLSAGVYKIVKLKSSASVAAKRGCLVYWDTSVEPSIFQVTTDVIGANGAVAGVLCNVITAGYYGIIQVDGIAWCLCKGTITTTGATGQPLVAVTDTQGRVDNVADATAITEAILQTACVGRAYDAPANGALKRVALDIAMKIPTPGQM